LRTSQTSQSVMAPHTSLMVRGRNEALVAIFCDLMKS
jgi:hypothetical protein